MKSFKNLKSYLLLTAYLFILIAGLFHYHSYSYEFNGEINLSVSSHGHQNNDFSDNISGICSLEHFFQSLNLDDQLFSSEEEKLLASKPFFIKYNFFLPDKDFFTPHPLRAPPII